MQLLSRFRRRRPSVPTSHPPAVSVPVARRPDPQIGLGNRFYIEPEVAQRFNTYASAAYPYEIGGLLRVVRDEAGDWHAIDLKIFPQQVSGVYFELDELAVANFTMELYRDGRQDEIADWKSLIHSHPSMTPFMSSTDRENITRLAGRDGFAFSVICSAEADPTANYYAVHYAQGGPLKAMVHNLRPQQPECLRGWSLIDERERQAIALEVRQLCTELDGTALFSTPALQLDEPLGDQELVGKILADGLAGDERQLALRLSDKLDRGQPLDYDESLWLIETLTASPNLSGEAQAAGERLADELQQQLDEVPLASSDESLEPNYAAVWIAGELVEVEVAEDSDDSDGPAAYPTDILPDRIVELCDEALQTALDRQGHDPELARLRQAIDLCEVLDADQCRQLSEVIKAQIEHIIHSGQERGHDLDQLEGLLDGLAQGVRV